ncbi:MAG: murein biosynthesis integral membrane protein MurJ [Gemmatimonadaceae bacterium]
MSASVPTPPPGRAAQSSARGSALVAAGIFLSRLLGLLRQSLIAKYLGVGLVSDAFNGAFRITNFLQNLFGEGALSASFIPVYANALSRGDDKEADRIAGAVAAILALVTALIVVLGIIAAPFVVKLVAYGFTGEKLDLAIRLTRILFPGAGIFVMSAWCLGILNSHRKFFLSYAAPVFWNVAMITALVFYGPRFGHAGQAGEVALAIRLGWASVIGAALQMGVQLPSVFQLVRHPRFVVDFVYEPVREVVRNFLPAFVSRGVVQLSAFVDVNLASKIAAEGVYTLLQNAQTIYVLPISLFGMSVSAAELPEMARDSGVDAAAFERLRARLNGALPRVAYFVVPSAVGFLVLGEAIAGVLLQHGKFSPTNSMQTWAILAGSAVGLLASALGRLYSSTFYALRDTRTPLWYAVTRVLLTGVLGYLFAFPLPRWLGLPAWTGAAGLTVSAGIAGWVEFLLLRRAITARIGSTGILPSLLVRLWGAGLAAGAAGWGVMRSMDPGHQTMRGIAALSTFALVYGLATLALGVPQAKQIASRILRR